MGFLAGSFDKSVFNTNSYKSAVGDVGNNGYAVVRIIPKFKRLGEEYPDTAVRGVYDYSSGGLSFSIEANWQDLGGIAGAVLPPQTQFVREAFSKINPAASVGGVSNIGAGLASQLIYQKSGYLEIKVPIMIVDWNGTGQPLMSALLLTNYCLPTKFANLADEAGKMATVVSRWLHESATNKKSSAFRRIIGTLGAGAIEGSKSFIEGVENIAEDLIKGQEGALAPDEIEAIREIASRFRSVIDKAGENIGSLDDAYTLRASPSPVIVEIGQFFRNNDMVIKSVDLEFSKEMTEEGPLFVKVNLSLSSRRILTSLDDVGMKPTGRSVSRYSELSQNANIFGGEAVGL